jgi:predicted small lipoprotein YifL
MPVRHLKLLPVLLVLAGCGQTGPLYLPDKAPHPQDIKTTPPQDEQTREHQE